MCFKPSTTPPTLLLRVAIGTPKCRDSSLSPTLFLMLFFWSSTAADVVITMARGLHRFSLLDWWLDPPPCSAWLSLLSSRFPSQFVSHFCLTFFPFLLSFHPGEKLGSGLPCVLLLFVTFFLATSKSLFNSSFLFWVLLFTTGFLVGVIFFQPFHPSFLHSVESSLSVFSSCSCLQVSQPSHQFDFSSHVLNLGTHLAHT